MSLLQWERGQTAVQMDLWDVLVQEGGRTGNLIINLMIDNGVDHRSHRRAVSEAHGLCWTYAGHD